MFASVESFRDELEKIAVETSALTGLLKRLNVKRFSRDPRLTSRASHFPKVGPNAPIDSGDIVIGKEWAKKNLPEGTLRQQRLAEKVVGLHEGAERQLKPLQPRRVDWSGEARPQAFYSHAHPEVLVQEHNLLSKLKPSGSHTQEDVDKVVDFVRGVRRGPQGKADVTVWKDPVARSAETVTREIPTEEEGLRNLFQKVFKDPRATEFLEHGQKVPKAMRKRLRRADPEVLTPWQEDVLPGIQ